jgi:hypothetical protein
MIPRIPRAAARAFRVSEIPRIPRAAARAFRVLRLNAAQLDLVPRNWL